MNKVFVKISMFELKLNLLLNYNIKFNLCVTVFLMYIESLVLQIDGVYMYFVIKLLRYLTANIEKMNGIPIICKLKNYKYIFLEI